jgi:hypothetical protein
MRQERIMHAIWMLANATQQLTHMTEKNPHWTKEDVMECIKEAIKMIEEL